MHKVLPLRMGRGSLRYQFAKTDAQGTMVVLVDANKGAISGDDGNGNRILFSI